MEENSSWTRWQLILFRWSAVFFTFVALGDLIWAFGENSWLFSFEYRFWQSAVPWLTRNVLLIEQPFSILGGADTGFAHMRMLWQALIAVLAAAIWTMLDKKSQEHRRLHYWVRVLVRYSLASMLLGYGASKIFHVQFPGPSLTSLIQPMGSLSGHSLLWNFMGASRLYQIFAGGIECAAALLLLWNRTAIPGALLAASAMANVVMMDWSYAVMVKFIATKMLLESIFLSAPLAPQVWSWFMSMSATPWWGSRWRWPLAALKAAAVCYLIYVPMQRASGREPQVANPGKPALYGVYRVQHAKLGAAILSESDALRWDMVAIGNLDSSYTVAVVRRSDENWDFYDVKLDEKQRQISMRGQKDKNPERLTYTRLDDRNLEFAGTWRGQALEMRLLKLDDPDFRLLKEGGPRWLLRW